MSVAPRWAALPEAARRGACALLAVVGVAVAGCGGSASMRTSVDDSSTVPLAGEGTTPDATPLATLASTDAVIVDLSDDMVTVSRGIGERDQEVLYSQSRVVPGWEQPIGIGSGYGLNIHAFSADFSRAVFTGQPVGLLADHVGVMDLRTGEVTDLTAARQGDDFSAAVLCEGTVGFVSRHSPRVENGDDEIVFLSRTGTNKGPGYCGGEPMTSRLSQPTVASPVSGEDPPPSVRREGSEDGAYWYGASENADGEVIGEGFVDAATGHVIPVDCVRGEPRWNSDGDDNETLLGWVGPRQVALGVLDPPGSVAVVDYRLATLDEAGRVSCAGGLPRTDKAITEVALSFDAKSILFTAEGTGGPEQYSLAIEGDGVPQLTTYPAIDDLGDGVEIYRAGPQ